MISKTIKHITTPPNPFRPATAPASSTHTQDTQEAVVVDVITNDSHPLYASDGYNVGTIKFRFLKSNIFRDDATLNWAWPAESNFSGYPLLDEIVVVHQSLNRFYYSPKINVSSRVTSHAVLGLNEELSPPKLAETRSVDLKKTVSNPIVHAPPPETLGKYFKDQDSVLRLRHDEGDIIIEGRSGHSIRFGAAWLKSATNFKAGSHDQAPNILMRVGPDAAKAATSTSPFSVVTEDINKDACSIWMVADQIIPLKYATASSKIHKGSISNFPARLDGKQIVMNTDRFVVNTKTGKVMGFAFDGIHWTSGQDFTVDAGQDYKSIIARNSSVQVRGDDSREVSGKQDIAVGVTQNTTVQGDAFFKVGGKFETTANDHVSLISKKVYLGSQSSEEQPVPLGAILAQFLSDFIKIHVSSASTYVVTPVGPGILSPSVVSQLEALQKQVLNGAKSSINSKVTFTV